MASVAIAASSAKLGQSAVQIGATPPKFVVIDGVRRLNPDYKTFMEKQGQKVTTALHPEEALPTVSTMAEFAQLKIAAQGGSAKQAPPPSLAASTESSMEIFQDGETCERVGLSPNALIEGIGKIFAKYEIPIGMMNKLLAFTEYHKVDIKVDDSGSMGKSDPKTGITRWQEAKARLKVMIEIMAYVPIPPISLSFLNRKFRVDRKEVSELILEHKRGETPELFIAKAHKLIDQAFAVDPSGGTPILGYLTNSLEEGKGKKIARYLFCDGGPDGGKAAQEEITGMIKDRSVPEDNPFTLISCSETASDVEWMKEAEEVASYCSEYDDFEEEAKEVAKDQGAVFPFTYGMYLVGQLVGAMNPDDLDAMDESVPFTKFTLDNLLGVCGSEEDYRRYFDGFKFAQQNRPITTPMDTIKKQQQWERSYHAFLHTPLAKNIPEVQAFKRVLEGGAPDALPPPYFEPVEKKV